jgi:hypothetical protein
MGGLAVETLFLLLFVGLWIAAAVVTGLKGKPWVLLLGLLIGWCWVFGSLRLAKPQSWWARRFYDSTKMNESQLRFGGGFDTPVPVFEYPRR